MLFRSDLDTIWNSIKVQYRYQDDGLWSANKHLKASKLPVTPVGGRLENGMWDPAVFDADRLKIANRIIEIINALAKP